MKFKAVLFVVAAMVFLVVAWEVCHTSFNVQTSLLVKAKHGSSLLMTEPVIHHIAPRPAPSKCGLSKVCPPDHFALRIRSGGADVVGPNICFEDRIIMNSILNNVGPGLNLVVINGTMGVVESYGFLNMISGRPDEILAFLKEIGPGRIVLVATFNDAAPKLTDQMREIFAGMGSAFITSLKPRDSWVFAGRVGAPNKSAFEKRAISDVKTNPYEKWPAMVEVSGCFPKNPESNNVTAT